MSNVFMSSYLNLSEEVARTFLATSIFPSSFTAAAEEFICGDRENMYLTELVRRGLVTYDPTSNRYLLHDEVRDFALPLARERTDLEEISRRHAVYYKDKFHEMTKLYRSGGDKALKAYQLFGQEWDNFDRGFTWAEAHIDHPDPAVAGLCSAYTSGGVELMRLYLQSMRDRQWLESSLRSAQKIGNRLAEGKHLLELGESYQFKHELKEALEYLNRAVLVFQELVPAEMLKGLPKFLIDVLPDDLIDVRRQESRAYGHIGYVYSAQGDIESAIKYLKLRLDIAKSINDNRGVSIALHSLGDEYFRMEGEANKREAIKLYRKALRLARKEEYILHEGRVLSSLGFAYAKTGNRENGLKVERQALNLSRQIGDLIGEAHTYGRMALIYREAALENANKAKDIYEMHSPGDYKNMDNIVRKLAA